MITILNILLMIITLNLMIITSLNLITHKLLLMIITLLLSVDLHTIICACINAYNNCMHLRVSYVYMCTYTPYWPFCRLSMIAGCCFVYSCSCGPHGNPASATRPTCDYVNVCPTSTHLFSQNKLWAILEWLPPQASPGAWESAICPALAIHARVFSQKIKIDIYIYIYMYISII